MSTPQCQFSLNRQGRHDHAAFLSRIARAAASDAEDFSSSSTTTTAGSSSSSNADNPSSIMTLSLSKPIGIVLEEVVEGQSEGVFVKDVGSGGSAEPYASQIRNAKLLSVGTTNVEKSDFDSVMELIVNSGSAEDTAVDLKFRLLAPPVLDEAEGEEEESEKESDDSDEYPIGTPVTIQVDKGSGGDTPLRIEAKVGDNLRKVLLENDVEVYQGMKQKLGNCGGAGQCTFCAMDFLESQGWADRSGYEDERLAKFPSARLSCLNNIQGPATIRKTQR